MEESAISVAVVQKASADQPDIREPLPKRQEELRAAYEANVVAGIAPYAGVRIQTLGEVQWIQQERGWSNDLLAEPKQRINLSGANLSRVILLSADLNRATLNNTDLREAILSGTQLNRATLSGADLSRATLLGTQFNRATLSGAKLFGAMLSGTQLSRATLSGADLREATLSGADLSRSTMSGADFSKATMSGADLSRARMDEQTQLAGVKLDTQTQLRDVYWGGAALTRVDWNQAPRLGDERAIREAKTREEHRDACQNAARAYRGLAIALRTQGLLLQASGYRLREQRLERKAAWYGRRYGEWLFSALLDLVAGYGEALERILISYVVVVGGFAAAYWAVTHYLETKLSALSWDEALVLSLTSFHGRGFFPGFLSLGDWVARLGALEAVIGLFIELILIATFSRRFLGN